MMRRSRNRGTGIQESEDKMTDEECKEALESMSNSTCIAAHMSGYGELRTTVAKHALGWYAELKDKRVLSEDVQTSYRRLRGLP